MFQDWNDPAATERELRSFVERASALLARLAGDDLAGAGRTLTGSGSAGIRLARLAGDGSRRSIYRLMHAGVPAVVVVNPLPIDRTHPDENEGFLAVREYLAGRAVRVPELYAADLTRGFLLLEDLGDVRLYELARRPGAFASAKSAPANRVVELYEQAIDFLIRMQAAHGPVFRPAAVPNPPYTRDFAITQEARYFHDELLVGVARRAPDFALIERDCLRLAGDAVRHGGVPKQGPQSSYRPVFMHRDFQSRNLMLAGDGLAVIDFQGAREGPPEYDLAALLYDPYVEMDAGVCRHLVDSYLAAAVPAGVPGLADPADERSMNVWRRIFLANAANRLLQAIGAFAKLGAREGRPGFFEHIPAALARLAAVLEERGDCPALLEIVRSCGDDPRCAGRHT